MYNREQCHCAKWCNASKHLYYLIFSVLPSGYYEVVCCAPVDTENEAIVGLPLGRLGAWLQRLNDQGLTTAVEDVIHVRGPTG